jgi:hypothetical protein
MNGQTFTFQRTPALRGQSVHLQPADLPALFDRHRAAMSASFVQMLEKPEPGAPKMTDGTLRLLVDLINSGTAGPLRFHADEAGALAPSALLAAGSVSINDIDTLELLELASVVVDASGGFAALVLLAGSELDRAAEESPADTPGRALALAVTRALLNLSRQASASENRN